jgi:electron transfer flavoprotein beta subunit
MDYIICVKQVPDTKEIQQDEETGSLVRDSAGSKPNPDDYRAIEACLQMREKSPGNIKAITMGPKQARASLRNALALGVDEAYHMMDKRFSGADVLATAYTLALGIKKIGLPDIIFCGNQSIDGDTGQVAAELAEFLSYTHVYYITEILDINDNEITVISNMGNYMDKIRVRLPVVLSIDSNSFNPRVSSFKDKMLAQKKPIEIIKLDDLEENDENNFGYRGSATRVRKMFVPIITRNGEMLNNSTEENVDVLLEHLMEWEKEP